MPDLIILAGMFVATLVLTAAVRFYSLSSGLIDTPNSRSSHNLPTPRGGGLSIAATYLVLLIVLKIISDLPAHFFYSLVAGGVLVGGVGWLDDYSDVAALYRFLVHFLAATIVVFLVGGLPPLQIGTQLIDLGWSGDLLSVIFLVWFTNLFNFMDGIDGIAASEAIFILGAALLCNGFKSAHYLIMLQAGLVAGCVGFLVWNWPPAKIFMGDVGSGFLGIVIGAIALISVSLGELSIWTWLILGSVFIVDATVTVVRRMMRGDSWYSAHRSHAYQHAAQRLHSHTKVTVSIWGINIIWLLPLGWASAKIPEAAWSLMLLAWAPLTLLALRLEAGRPGN